MSSFSENQRVLFRSVPDGFHAAFLGVHNKVMHLNAQDEQGQVQPITGTLLHYDPLLMQWFFRPDGWPAWARGQGIYIDEAYLSELADPTLVLPGPITDPFGRRL